MLRKLSAIEIAEGALLADIAIIFQLIATYLPVGGGIFQVLVPTIFTVLVLRRGFYAGIMGVCVAIFVTCMLTGLGAGAIMLLECGAGVFLGITMKYRMRHLLLVFLGVTSSALLVYAGTWFFAFLLGTSPQHFVIQFHKVYDTAIHFVNFAALQLGLDGVWRHNLYPTVAHIASFVFTYWWEMMLVIYWIILWPVVIFVYYITNVLVRLLGYKVRPFPGGKLERFLHALVRFIIIPAGKRKRKNRGPVQSDIPENSKNKGSINERSKVEV
ncbi:MAG: DUF2232 domain-containing protein [Ktedonobacteraceae bacterium]